MATRTHQITYTTTLSTLTCGCCEIPFAIPESLHDKVKRDGSSFYCPNGHYISYSDTENKRLQRRLDNMSAAYDRERDRAAYAERSASAYKGQATRLRNRAKNGVCPCCHRTFQQLARHMAAKHPDFEPEASSS